MLLVKEEFVPHSRCFFSTFDEVMMFRYRREDTLGATCFIDVLEKAVHLLPRL